MIYQSGYLTIKGYNRDFGTFLLDYPNNEVKSGFVSLVAASYLKPQENLNSWVRSVVISLRKGEPEQLRKLFTSFLASIPYTMRSKKDETEKERYFHYTLYLIFRLISVYTVYTEKEQSQGRADCIVETPYYVYVFEFKRDGSADEALAQIEEKGYARPYESDKRRLYKIGVNFSSETGTVEEWKCLNIGWSIGEYGYNCFDYTALVAQGSHVLVIGTLFGLVPNFSDIRAQSEKPVAR